jgi:hypothetical protein
MRGTVCELNSIPHGLNFKLARQIKLYASQCTDLHIWNIVNYHALMSIAISVSLVTLQYKKKLDLQRVRPPLQHYIKKKTFSHRPRKPSNPSPTLTQGPGDFFNPV